MANDNNLLIIENGVVKGFKSEVSKNVKDKITELTIPSEVTAIETAALSNLKELVKVSLPEGLKRIGNSTFHGCKKLKSIIIPEGVERLGKTAFGDCRELETVVLPQTITSLGSSVFSECKAIKSINIPKNFVQFDISDYITGWEKLESIEIPDTFTEIHPSFFTGCHSLKTIQLPDTITKIGNNAFEYCKSLKNINLPEGITEIPDYAFRDCCSLETIKLPDSIIKIGNSAFFNCSSLEKISLPETVIEIGQSAFEQCSSLKALNIPQKTKNLPDNFCSGCTMLESIEIPDGVESIGERAFVFCKNLRSVKLSSTIKKIALTAFDGCDSIIEVSGITEELKQKCRKNHYHELKLPPHYVNYNTQHVLMDMIEGDIGIQEVEFPKGRKRLDSNMRKELFGNNAKLYKVIVPDTFTEIGELAFSSTKLISITFEEGLKKINHAAFLCCNHLSALVLPKGVEKIAEGAFAECKNLTQIIINEGPEKILINSFSGSPLKCLELPQSVKTISWDNNEYHSWHDPKYNWEIRGTLMDSLEYIYIPLSVKTMEGSFPHMKESLCPIRYEGTKEDWEKIEMPDSLRNKFTSKKMTFQEKRG